MNRHSFRNLNSLASLLSYFVTASGFDAFIGARMQALLRRNLHSDVRRFDHASTAQNADQRVSHEAQGLPRRSSTPAFEVLPYFMNT